MGNAERHTVEIFDKKDALIQKLQYENEYLRQQLKELKRLIFGSKSERFVPAGGSQLSLFDGLGQEIQSTQTEEIKYTREKPIKEKQQPVRASIPSHLPRIEEIIEPAHIEKGSKKIGEEITEVLEYNPAKVYVRKIVRPKYAPLYDSLQKQVCDYLQADESPIGVQDSHKKGTLQRGTNGFTGHR